MLFVRDSDVWSKEAISYSSALDTEPTIVLTKSRTESIPNLDWKSFDYLISFRSFAIIPSKVLNQVKVACINFHPAPPWYRGSGGSSWALLHDDREFGVTVHEMEEKVDAGRILRVRTFAIERSWDIEKLISYSNQQLLEEFRRLISHLAEHKSLKGFEESSEYSWSGELRRISSLDPLQIIGEDTSETELELRIRALHTVSHPIRLRFKNQNWRLEK